MKHTVHELDDNQRYLSTSTGKGFTLQVYTTPINTSSEEEHLVVLAQKVASCAKASVDKENSESVDQLSVKG